MIPDGWASRRAARMSARVALTDSGGAGAERERGARHHLAGAEVGAAVREAELVGLAPLDAARAGHVHPLEHPREVAAVRVRVHLHRAADRARDVHAELEAGETGPGGAGGRLRQPGPATAQQPLAALLDRGERAVQLHDESSESRIRNQEIRSGAHHSYRQPLGLGPGQQLDEPGLGVGTGEPVGAAARADRREARERVVALDPRRGAHDVSLRASSSTSPAPIVRSTSPSPSSSRRKRSASAWRGSHHTGRPAAASAAAPATSSPLTPGKSSGTLARGVDVQHHHQVGERQRLAELAGEQARAREEVRLEADHQPPRGLRAGRVERGPHLGRMVGVVVEHPGAAARCARGPRSGARRP